MFAHLGAGQQDLHEVATGVRPDLLQLHRFGEDVWGASRTAQQALKTCCSC